MTVLRGFLTVGNDENQATDIPGCSNGKPKDYSPRLLLFPLSRSAVVNNDTLGMGRFLRIFWWANCNFFIVRKGLKGNYITKETKIICTIVAFPLNKQKRIQKMLYLCTSYIDLGGGGASIPCRV
jgi:hypothetical protein